MTNKDLTPLLEGTDDYTYGGSGITVEDISGVELDNYGRTPGQAIESQGLKVYMDFLLEPGGLLDEGNVIKIKELLNKYVLGSPTLPPNSEVDSDLLKAINIYTQDSQKWEPGGDIFIDIYENAKAYEFMSSEGSFYPMSYYEPNYRGGGVTIPKNLAPNKENLPAYGEVLKGIREQLGHFEKLEQMDHPQAVLLMKQYQEIETAVSKGAEIDVDDRGNYIMKEGQGSYEKVEDLEGDFHRVLESHPESILYRELNK